jgi:hypothetical protein
VSDGDVTSTETGAEGAKIENANLDCLFFIVHLYWLSIRGFTNILISIPAKDWTVPGRVEGRRSV